jgi:hypothetical protein
MAVLARECHGCGVPITSFSLGLVAMRNVAHGPSLHFAAAQQTVAFGGIAASWLHDPRPVSAKGSGSDRIVDSAQGSLFTPEQLASAEAIKFEPINTGVWYLCVSVDGDDVRAELSLPSAIENGSFGRFIERIFIVGGGEWSELVKKLQSDTSPAEFQPTITRK